jgi:hypothetical protein
LFYNRSKSFVCERPTLAYKAQVVTRAGAGARGGTGSAMQIGLKDVAPKACPA